MTNVRVIQNGGTGKAVVKGFFNHLLFAMLLFCFCLFVSLLFLISGVTFFFLHSWCKTRENKTSLTIYLTLTTVLETKKMNKPRSPFDLPKERSPIVVTSIKRPLSARYI